MATSAIGRVISGYLDHLTVERGLADNSISSYRRDLRRYEEFCLSKGLTDPKQITSGHISDFLVELRLGNSDHPELSSTSAARTLIAVRGFHAFLAREGLTQTDPARAVKPPSAAKQLPKALSFSDIEALLNAVGVDAEGDLSILMLRDRALLELLYGTGARISELINLNVDDVSHLSVDTPILKLHGKGDKQRLVPVGRPAMKALEAYLVRARPVLAKGGKGTPALFLNARGGKLSRQSAWQILQDAADRAGLSGKVSPHTMRHSFATHLLENGADVRVVQELLGHASVTTTQIYTMVTVDQLREVYATAHPRK
ncbi:MAG: tyrosine recombinase XerD [Actinomycetota bacterium]|jgi:integrase/recombinase XerD